MLLTAPAGWSKTLAKQYKQPRPFPMGRVVDDSQGKGGTDFVLRQDDWKHHMAVLGGTGGGKSKFLELYIRCLLHEHQGGLLIDPHGDLADNLMAFVARKKFLGDDRLWRRVHYLEVGPKSAFSFDPFADAPRRGTVSDTEYFDWLVCKVDTVVRAFLRNVTEADQDMMLRMRRWLTNIVFACGVALDDQNTHVGLAHARVFTNPRRNDFGPFLARVWPFLDEDMRADFGSLRDTQSEVIRDKLESTINRLRRILPSRSVKAVFGQNAPSINMRRIIENREFVIVRLARTRHFSNEQKQVVGGLLINDVIEAKLLDEEIPEDQRVPFTMIVDESGEFLGEDLKWSLGATRKYKLALVLAAQDLSTFAKGELDIAPKILSQCGTVVTFRQSYEEDKKALVDRIGTENLDFTPHWAERQLDRGQNRFYVPEFSFSTNDGEAASVGEQEGASQTDTEQKSQVLTNQHGNAHAVTNSSGSSHAGVAGASNSVMLDKDGHKVSATKTGHLSASEGRNESAGTTDTANSSVAMAEGTTLGRALQKSRSVNHGLAINRGKSATVSYKLMSEQIRESVWEKNGLEAGPIADQRERMMQQLHGLRTAEAMVSTLAIRGGFPVKIAHVPELWHPDVKWNAVACIKAMVTRQHPYNFCPETVDARVDAPAPLTNGQANGNGATHSDGTNGNGTKNGQANGPPKKNAFPD